MRVSVSERHSKRTVVGRSGDPEGGPYILLTLEIETDKIVSVACDSNGCPAAQMAGRGVSTIIKGKTCEQAKNLDSRALELIVGGFPEGKGYYGDMAIEALMNALENAA